MQELDMTKLLDISGLPGVEFNDNIPVVYEPTVLEEVHSNFNDRRLDLEVDYSSSRESYHHQQHMLMEMAKIALENAKNSESPKHVEAFVRLMETMNSTSANLLKVHKEMQAITAETPKTPVAAPQGQMHIENATVFVGSPADLMDIEGSQFDIQSAIEGEIE